MGEPEDAARCLRRALELAPEEAAARKELALALHNWGVRERAAGRVERALELAEEALGEDGGLTEAWLAKGNALADLDRVEESLAAFDRLLEIDPAHGDGWLNKGATLGNEGRMAEARECFERAAELGVERAREMAERCVVEPGLTVDQWLLFASGSREDGRLEDALRLYEEGVVEHPRSADLWYAMAGLLEKMGREDEAMAAYKRVVAIDPGRNTAWLFLGELMGEEAGRDYRERGGKAIEGGRLFREGRFAEALQCYLVALQKGHEAARERVGECLAAIAAECTKTAAEWFAEGQDLVVKGGRAAEALACFERAVGMDPGNVKAWWGKALMLADLGREAEARAAFAECVRLAPENADLRVSRAAWHYQSKRYEEAMAGYQEARELGHVQAWQGVVLCREALGLDPFTGRAG
jgi:tetratricopeptide (TPR) repeat protein